ncbi:MAG: hypothetical protein AAF725_11645 [Acidobacteriota bacterium]
MAQANPRLIEALRITARRLDSGADYRWTHMGRCNCGHLAQTVTRKSSEELHRIALQKAGDWSQQAVDHCPTSGLPMDHVIESLLDLGLNRDDLCALERLSDRRILKRLPVGERRLDKRTQKHVVLYLRTWADWLEERFMATREVPAFLPDSLPGEAAEEMLVPVRRRPDTA